MGQSTYRTDAVAGAASRDEVVVPSVLLAANHASEADCQLLQWCAREARGLVGQMICPTSRSPWPARGPLGRLREARQDPGEARTVATRGIVRHAHYDLTRVKLHN